MRIIQIGGVARSGKSTLAHAIAKKTFEMGFTPIILPFAKAIKDEAERMGITKDKDNLAYREFCQNLGASKRIDNPNYWIDQAHKDIEYYYEKEKNLKNSGSKYWEHVIIQDDVRYMNEIVFGREINAVQLFVDCADRLDDLDAGWRKHESEEIANGVQARDPKYDDLFPTVIINSGNIEEFRHFVDLFIEPWLKGIYKCNCLMCRAVKEKKSPSKSQVTDHLLAMLGMSPLTEDEKRMLDEP
jgi:hypothetical protein